jgi:hypothetical protein
VAQSPPKIETSTIYTDLPKTGPARAHICGTHSQRYCRRLSPLIYSISFRISCARDLTDISTSSSNHQGRGWFQPRYSSFKFSTTYLTTPRPKILHNIFNTLSERVCIKTCNNKQIQTRVCKLLFQTIMKNGCR